MAHALLSRFGVGVSRLLVHIVRTITHHSNFSHSRYNIFFISFIICHTRSTAIEIKQNNTFAAVLFHLYSKVSIYTSLSVFYLCVLCGCSISSSNSSHYSSSLFLLLFRFPNFFSPSTHHPLDAVKMFSCKMLITITYGN